MSLRSCSCEVAEQQVTSSRNKKTETLGGGGGALLKDTPFPKIAGSP